MLTANSNITFSYFQLIMNDLFKQVSQLYAFFWVITRRLDFICRRFGTFCLFHLHSFLS